MVLQQKMYAYNKCYMIELKYAGHFRLVHLGFSCISTMSRKVYCTSYFKIEIVIAFNWRSLNGKVSTLVSATN